jgi:hypothetical protein
MSVGLLAANQKWAQVPDGYEPLVEQLLRAPGVDPDRSALVDEAGAVWSRPGFDTILSHSRLSFSPFDYQLATMQTVLRRMRGRAILADEVGLGKTIEAGLVLSELRIRGLAERALVITPAGLVSGARSWSASSRCPPRSRYVVAGRMATTALSCWHRSLRPGVTLCAPQYSISGGTR